MVEIDDEYWQHQHHHQPANTEAHHQQVRRTSQGSEPGQIVLTELLPRYWSSTLVKDCRVSQKVDVSRLEGELRRAVGEQ